MKKSTKKPKGVFAGTYLSREDYSRLKDQARQEGRSFSGQIRYYVVRGLTQDHREPK